MIAFALRRLLAAVPIALAVGTLGFLLLHLTPGDPATLMLPPDADPRDIAQVRAALGLDKPLPAQYTRFLGNLLRADLGSSITQRIPVMRLISEGLGASAELALAAVAISVIVGTGLGVVAALRRGSWLDTGSMVLAVVTQSMPAFWIQLLAIIVFSLRLGLLPPAGRGPGIFEGLAALVTTGAAEPLGETLRRLVLPATTLGLYTMGLLARLIRSYLIDVLHADYIRTARAKGLGEQVVVIRHGLRNALLPVLTVTGLQLGTVMGGAVVTETVFAWPGIGRLMVQSLALRDFPVVQGVLIVSSILYVLVNLVVDIAYAAVDPRIRYR